MNHDENEPTNPHDSWAEYYDCVYKLAYGDVHQRFTDQTLRVIDGLVSPPARIVDFGAGTGRLAIPLAQLGYRVAAVEPSAEMCRVLRAKAAAGVEAAVASACVACQPSSIPAEQRHPVGVAVFTQSICRPFAGSGFDLGLCVFTVLNYLVEEDALRQSATVAASAIRPGGRLLVSFVENTAPMIDFFSAGPRKGESRDRRCRAERKIKILPLQERLYEYDEQSEMIKDGKASAYSDNFRLREWTRDQIVAAIEAGGFKQEGELTDKVPGSGEIYLLFSRNSPVENRPAGPPAGMTEDPKDVFREATEAACFENASEQLRRQREKTQRWRDAQVLLENLHEQKIFFYPGAYCHDWEPLHRLTHLCDTFIFCDWAVAAEDVTGDFHLPGVETDDPIIPLGNDDVAYLANVDALPYRIRKGVQQFPAAHVKPWGKYALVRRTVGNVTRQLHFFYLGIEGITAYFNLFAPHKTAPRILCMMFGMDPNGRHFGDWADGLLGKIIRGVGPLPDQTIGFGGPGSGWPHEVLWQRFAGWRAATSPSAYVRPGIPRLLENPRYEQAEGPAAAPPEPLGNTLRRVVVRRGSLTPENVDNSDAVVLSLSAYIQHLAHWPEHSKILLLLPPGQGGQLPGPDNRVRFVGHKAPLHDALTSITAACSEEDLHRVASVGIGYEDEGPELDVWRRQGGPAVELTIYCEHEGDVVSLGPYADEIQQ